MAQLPNNPKTGKPFKSDEELQKFVLNFLKGPTRIEKPRDPEADEPVLIESGGTGKIVRKKDIERVRHQDKLREAKEQYEQNLAKMEAAMSLFGGGKGGARPTRALPKSMQGKFVKTIADLAKHQPKTAAKIERDMDAKQASKSPRQPAKKAGSPPRIVDQTKEPKSVKEPPSVFERISTQVTESFAKQEAIHKKANDAYNKLERLRNQLPRPKQEVIDKAEADYKKAEAEARTALKAEQTRIAEKEKEGRQYKRTRAPIRKKLEPKRPEAKGETMTLRGRQPSPRVASQPRPTGKPKLSIGMDGVVRKPEQSRPKPPEPPKPTRGKPKLSLVPEPKPVEMPKRKPMEQAKLDTIKKLQEQNPANLIYGKKPPKDKMTSPLPPQQQGPPIVPKTYGPTVLTKTGEFRGPSGAGEHLLNVEYEAVFDNLKQGRLTLVDPKSIKVDPQTGKPDYSKLKYLTLEDHLEVLSPHDRIIVAMVMSLTGVTDSKGNQITPTPQFEGHEVRANPAYFRQRVGDLLGVTYPETVGMTGEQRNKFLSDLTGGTIKPEAFSEKVQPAFYFDDKGRELMAAEGVQGADNAFRQLLINLGSDIAFSDPAIRSGISHESRHFVDPNLRKRQQKYQKFEKIMLDEKQPIRKRVAALAKIKAMLAKHRLGLPYGKIPSAALLNAMQTKGKAMMPMPEGLVGKIKDPITTLKQFARRVQYDLGSLKRVLTYYGSRPEILTHWLGPTRAWLSRIEIGPGQRTVRTREDLLERMELVENHPQAFDEWMAEMKINLAIPNNAPPEVHKAYELFFQKLWEQIKTDKKMQDRMLKHTVKAGKQPPRSMPA